MIELGLSLGGTLLSMIGGFQQGRTARAAGEYNRKIALLAARDKAAAGRIQKEKFLAKAEQFKGSQKAAFAATGARLDSGTIAHAMASTAQQIEEDAALLEWMNAGEVANLINQGNMAEYQGRAGQYAGNINAGASLLSGLGNAYGMFTETKFYKERWGE